MKIIFLGTPNYLDPIIQALDENFNLIKTIRSTLAFQPRVGKLNLEGLQPDLLVVASFGKIIPQEILKIPRLGAINIHPSKLPLYRGPSPIQSQIIDGVTQSAISFILMDEEMDHGPILYQEPFTISENDTFESLCQKMFVKSAEIFPQIIQDLGKSKTTPRLQQHAIATYCNHIKKEDGYFDINNPPKPTALDKIIRAYYPWPTAWTKWNGRIVKFLPNIHVIPSAPEESVNTEQISHDVRNDNNKYLIQMEGKKAVPIKDFLNGYPDFPQINLIY